MKPPRQVRIGPHTFRVHVDTNGVMVDEVGTSDADSLMIALRGGSPHTAMADTLLHEITHAVLRPLKLEHELEERVCMQIGSQLLDVLRSNPKLVEYLVA